MNDRPDQFATAQPIKKSPRAFTLVELLVVIAILGGLAALVVPAVKSGLSSAKSVQSVSHLQQTGILLMNYTKENDNRIPYSIDWARMGGTPPGLLFFQRLLAESADSGFQYGTSPYSATRPLPGIFYDPCLEGARLPQHPMGGFGVNGAIALDAGATQNRGVSLLTISKPSQKVVYCSTSAKNSSFSSEWGFSGDDFARQGIGANPCPDPRNAGRVASLFLDGHVEKLEVKGMDQATRQLYFTP